MVLELVGAANLAENLQALAIGGRIAVIGVGGTGPKAEINLLALMGKRARIHGSTLRARPLEEKAIAMRLVESEVLPLFEAGPPRACRWRRTLPARRGRAGLRALPGGGKLGKIVLLPEAGPPPTYSLYAHTYNLYGLGRSPMTSADWRSPDLGPARTLDLGGGRRIRAHVTGEGPADRVRARRAREREPVAQGRAAPRRATPAWRSTCRSARTSSRCPRTPT